ncbi:MAG TPA: hypothetical protein VHV10_04665 [Ktedonobacteraceae bacterium]|nr:hypothetical protein [Ktedonobacteraceae bacterium]
MRGIPFDWRDKRIMCFAHIINICCQHVINEFTNIKLTDSAAEYIAAEVEGNPQHQTTAEAVIRDPVALGRNIVRVLRSSGQRRNAFKKLIQDGNAGGWFNTPLREVQLLRDVKTRWDSVYFMIKRLGELQPVRHKLMIMHFFSFYGYQALGQAITHFLSLPVNRELEKYQMTDREWEVLTKFELILEVSTEKFLSKSILTSTKCPHAVQQVMSSESTPVLSGAIPAHELFMSRWEFIRDTVADTSDWVNVGLRWATEYYCRMDYTTSYIVSMCKFILFRMFLAVFKLDS